MSDAAPSRRAAVLATGWLGIFGNLLAVGLLRDQPGAYHLDGLDDWAREIALHPAAACASAVAFTLGLLALALWALELAEVLGGAAARVCLRIVAMGAILDALGCVAPAVLAAHVRDAATPGLARALLGTSLGLDALFNLALGVGLLGLGLLWPERGWSKLRILAVVAGLLSVPVSAQAFVDSAARLLPLAAAFWLAFVAASGWKRWPSGAPGERRVIGEAPESSG